MPLMLTNSYNVPTFTVSARQYGALFFRAMDNCFCFDVMRLKGPIKTEYKNLKRRQPIVMFLIDSEENEWH